MYSLIRYLVKYGAFILFVIFEILAFYWVITYNQNQKRIFKYSAEEITGSIYETFDNLTSYIHLRAVSDSLAARNARLEAELRRYQFSADYRAIDNTIRDSSSQFSWIPARVISNSVKGRNNMMMIDKGSLDGLRRGLGVLSDSGPVGIVVNTTKNYASVMSILNSESMLSVSLKHSDHFGSLIWESTNPSVLKLDAIPKYVDLNIGDTVVTSGYSLIFPGNRDVGRIMSYEVPKGSNFYDIEVKLMYDMSDLDYVFVVKNKDQSELDSLYAR